MERERLFGVDPIRTNKVLIPPIRITVNENLGFGPKHVQNWPPLAPLVARPARFDSLISPPSHGRPVQLSGGGQPWTLPGDELGGVYLSPVRSLLTIAKIAINCLTSVTNGGKM